MVKGSAEPKIVRTDSIELDAIDDHGTRQVVKLRARIVEPRGQVIQLRKQEQEHDLEVPTSQADDEKKYQRLLGRKVIAPPINLSKLLGTKDESTELGQAIDAMVTNTVGFGWQLKERTIPDELRARLAPEIERERLMLDMRLKTVHPMESLTGLREKAASDKHSCGNGYLELISSARGELVGSEHVQGHTIRLTVKDRVPTKVLVPRIRPDRDFMSEEVPMWYRFRRFGQVREDDSVIWFREAGDPRTLHKRTGVFHKDPREVRFSNRATSLVHFKIYHAMTPYGMPLWTGNSLSVRGSRSAEEINWATINNNNIPSMMIIVENGRLTDGSIDRLREWTEKHIASSQNYSTFLILEGEATEEGAPNPANFRIRLEPLKAVQQKDELFQEYQEHNAARVRQSFRLPPIFVGRSMEYNRATADTSRDVADEQIFAPERQRDDHLINRFFLAEWGARFHVFRSNHPNVTDDIELIRLMAIAEKSGAMTPRRADSIIRDVFGDNIGPMPTGIDLDKPFSITFAEAQQGISSETPGGGTARKVIENLVDMRQKIEKELDARFHLEDGGA